MVGSAAQPGVAAVLVEVQAELGGDHDLVADRGERFADEFFVGERPVDLGGVEERDAEIDRGADERDGVVACRDRAVALGHAHAAETER